MFIYITMETTTVLLEKGIKKRLEKFRAYPRESINSIVERLMNMATDDEPLSKEEIAGIKRGLKDIEEGRVYTTAQLKKKLGI